jgi:hypothetical protein
VSKECRCFSEALADFAVLRTREPAHLSEWRLIHALVWADEGFFSHAWLENLAQGRVYFSSGNGPAESRTYDISAEDVYGHFNLRDLRMYTCERAFLRHLKTGHAGPWSRKWRQQCGLEPQRREGVVIIHLF